MRDTHPTTLPDVLRWREPAGSARPAILVVEDERLIRTVLSHLVIRAGYRVVAANGPADALALLSQEPDIALVVSDVRMPTSEAGVHFIQHLRRRWPKLPLAAVTGYPDDLRALHGTAAAPDLVVAKPFRASHVMDVLNLATRPVA
jgi:CheY-like chemotaxis protein